MKDVTKLLNAIDSGDKVASEDLLPVVYEDLRALAARKMASERPDSTLQPTALVHEAYMRLVGSKGTWSHRGHFFAAAAEAMRRILVDAARARSSQKRGGGRPREGMHESSIAAPGDPDRVLAVNDALEEFATSNPEAAELVKLRYFAGFTNADAAEILNISPRQANKLWAYARVWLAAELGEDDR